ncbi:MAG: zinc-dependent metalloprotease [Deferribacteres bacterium]|nr:zinc-dependent metalloprotease [Deferribacteres bacterium]
MHRLFRMLMICLLLQSVVFAQESKTDSGPKTIADFTQNMQKFDGYFPFYWHEKDGKIWLEIDRWDTELLYINSLPAGIGSNDIGLDRGQLGDIRIVTFQRVGPKVLMVQPNYSYRADTDNPAERKAVEDAFATSVLWGFEVAAENASAVLVDATAFLMRDAHYVSGRLQSSNQGNYKLDGSRSVFYLPRTKNFPKNTEFEAILTFTGDAKGRWIQSVTPSADAVTVRQHHSFVELPEPGFQTRTFDPRAGFFGVDYADYATPISEPLRKRLISRHRLQKKNPNAAVSESVEPIVYYLDPGTPEPIRSALLEGASWWNQAFEAAGYKDAFQVKMLPEDADPMDVRYNVINWVHRSTRGWSYGSTVTDPRTSEIIKGHVTLGSLRVRQDFLIAEGLLAPYHDGESVPPELQEMALARIRQLSAHEVGHTLGLAHNYAASMADRASVMDYPHPLALKSGDKIDLSDAYDTGIGAWDKVAITYGYQDFPEGTDEQAALNAIIQKSLSDGLLFITDADARPAGSAHPMAHLWDNGNSAVDELNRLMEVRKTALHNFSEKNIRSGQPLALLEETFVPLYLSHRYQIEAASKVLGGLMYTYALRGDGQQPTAMIPAKEQWRAFEALLATLKPEALAVPERILQLMPPRAFGYSRSRELFSTRTGLTFDPLAAAETAANMTIDFLLHPQRLARLIEHEARDQSMPGMSEVIDKLLDAIWKNKPSNDYDQAVQQVVDQAILTHLMALVADENAANQVRAVAHLKIQQLRTWLQSASRDEKNPNRKAHLQFAAAQVQLFQQNPAEFVRTLPQRPPDGSPIGMDAWCSFQQ